MNRKPDPAETLPRLNTDAQHPNVLWDKIRKPGGMVQKSGILRIRVGWTALQRLARPVARARWLAWLGPRRSKSAEDLVDMGREMLGRSVVSAYQQILPIITPVNTEFTRQLNALGVKTDAPHIRPVIVYESEAADVALEFAPLQVELSRPVWARTVFPAYANGMVRILLDSQTMRWGMTPVAGFRVVSDPRTLILREALLSLGFGYNRNPHSLMVDPAIDETLTQRSVTVLPGADVQILRRRVTLEQEGEGRE